MAVQTTYQESLDAGRVGAIADTTNKVLISRTAEGAAIGFGVPIAQGTADRGARATATGDTTVIGITVRERSATDDQWAVGESMRVMKQGAIYVEAAATVAAGDAVHVIVDGGTFSNTGGVEIPGALYESSGDAGDLVQVRLA